MITNEDLANRLKQIRLEKGVTEKEMAKAIGSTEEYIINIENCIKFPTFKKLQKICDYFEINLYLFFNFNIKYPIRYNNFIKEYMQLDDNKKKIVDETLKLLINYDKEKNS